MLLMRSADVLGLLSPHFRSEAYHRDAAILNPPINNLIAYPTSWVSTPERKSLCCDLPMFRTNPIGEVSRQQSASLYHTVCGGLDYIRHTATYIS